MMLVLEKIIINQNREEIQMKAQVLTVVLAVMVLSGLFFGGQVVEAQPEPISALTVESLFAALNQGDTDAVSMFAAWHRDGRRYAAIGDDQITSLANGLDIVRSEVEISDGGVAWAQQSIMAVVYHGRIQRIYVTGMRLTPWQYW
jgi:hypothetical protein